MDIKLSNRIKTIATAVLLICCLQALPQKNKTSQLPECKVNFEFAANSLDSLKLHGFLGQKLDLCIGHGIKEQNVEALISPFRNRTEQRMWQTEFWGKWITSAISAYKFTKDPELLRKIEEAVDGLIATQTPDGYIGNYADNAHLKEWDIWGRKYCLLGLLGYYDLAPTKNTKALEAAKKLANHLLTEVGPGKANIVLQGNYRGLAASSILEPMVLLYKRTGDKQYLDFAKYITEQWETPDGPQLISKALENVPVYKRIPYVPGSPWTTNGQKAYEMMSCYEGLLELYSLDGNPDWLTAVENTVNSIIRDEINIVGSGSAYECWFQGKKYQTEAVIHYNEICVTTTWIKLCTKLFMLTAKPKYANEIEKSMYNALLAGLTPDGHTFTKYPPLEGIKQISGGQCGMELNCCGANGPRALALYPQLIYTQNEKGLFINFFEDSKTIYTTPSRNKVRIKQTGNYPVDGNLEIEVDPERDETFAIGVRLPGWSNSSLLKVNELAYEGGGGDYQRLVREWKKGDKISIRLDLRGKLVKEGNFFAITRGPLVLARDARFNDGNMLEPAFSPQTADGYIELVKNEKKPGDMFASFSTTVVTGANTEPDYQVKKTISLCDYASAGNTWDAKSMFKIWFRRPLDSHELKN